MKHILVVDDSAVIRKVARRILESGAMRVSEAEDGQTAIDLCRAEMPDAMLLDLAMPELDGHEVLREVRRLEGGDRLRVVVCSLENDVAQIARAKHAGADEVVLKPFTKATLTPKFEGLGFL